MYRAGLIGSREKSAVKIGILRERDAMHFALRSNSRTALEAALVQHPVDRACGDECIIQKATLGLISADAVLA